MSLTQLALQKNKGEKKVFVDVKTPIYIGCSVNTEREEKKRKDNSIGSFCSLGTLPLVQIPGVLLLSVEIFFVSHFSP